MDYILLVYAALIVFSFFGKNKSEDYLSVEYSSNMRGIAAIGIILHHMSERITGGILFPYLGVLGLILVCFFFFLSGYGLTTQYMKKKEHYLNGFIKKRGMYIVIVYLLDVAFYAIARALLGNKVSITVFLKSIIFGGVAENAWYMIIQILLYFAFYFVFKLRFINSIPKKIACVFALETAFVIFCVIKKESNVWYMSNYGFVLGMLWAYYKEKIDAVLKKHYYLVLFGVLLIFGIFYASRMLSDRLGIEALSSVVHFLFLVLIPVVYVIILVVLEYKLKPNWFIWKWLGGISLEIYLIHGFVYIVLRSNIIWIENDILWTLLTIVISIAMAYPISLMNKQIAKFLKR